jgi:hypothetical protein
VDNSVTQPYYGTKCLRIISNSGDTYGHLGAKENGWGSIPVEANQTYLISMWVKTNVAQSTVQIWVVRRTGRTQATAEGGMKNYARAINTANKWTRVYCEYTAESGYPYIGLRLDNDSAGSTIYVDAIQIEKAEPGQQPGSFSPAGMTTIDGGHINTATLDAQSGKIGGFAIGTKYIANGTTSLSGSESTRVYLGLDGIALGNKFKVTKEGVLSASDVNITGGGIKLNNGVFEVKNDGTLTASAGTVGGWKITENTLTSSTYSANGALISQHGWQKNGVNTYAFAISSPSSSSWKYAAFNITHEGKVAILDTSEYVLGEDGYEQESEGDETNAAGDTAQSGSSSAEALNGATNFTSSTYHDLTASSPTLKFRTGIGPNRLYFYDRSNTSNFYTTGSISFKGALSGKTTGSSKAECGNYFVFNKSIALSGSEALTGTAEIHEKESGKNPSSVTETDKIVSIKLPNGNITKKGKWNALYRGINARNGISILTQGIMFRAKWFGEEYSGYTIELGASRANSSAYFSDIRNTIVKGRNIFFNAFGGATSGYDGYVNVLCKQLNCSAATIRFTQLPEIASTGNHRQILAMNTSGNNFGKLVKGKENVSSSRRVKTEISSYITDTTLNPNNLYNTEIVQFKYKPGYLIENDPRENKNIVGFIVEDLITHYPIAVDRDEDGLPEGWQPAYLIPPMLKLIQDQKKEIDELKEQLTNQQQQIDYILSKLG